MGASGFHLCTVLKARTTAGGFYSVQTPTLCTCMFVSRVGGHPGDIPFSCGKCILVIWSVFSDTQHCSAFLQPSTVYSWDPKDHTYLLHLPALCGQFSGQASSSSLSAFLHTVSLIVLFISYANVGKNAERTQVPFTTAPKVTYCRTAVPGHHQGADVHPPHACFPGSPCTQLCPVCNAIPVSPSSLKVWH